MIEVEVSPKDVDNVTRILQNMKGDKIVKAIILATNRAAITARKAGTQEIRKIYVAKAGNIKSRVALKRDTLGTTLMIKGTMESVKQFRATKQRKGIFVTIKKGNGSLIPRSFDLKGRFVARTSKKAFPLKGLYGPAVPQLFGNDAVMAEMERAAMDMYDKRLEHELNRLMGD